MKSLSGKKVLITGGASGIGKIMGKLVLQKGAELIIWDINPVAMNETVNEFSKLGRTAGYSVDVSDSAKVSAAAQEVNSKHGVVDVVINNAGIIVGKFFHEHSADEIKRTMDINANAPMYVTMEFLPGMMNQNSGHICNIASSAGLVSNPKMSVYVASKWSVVGWSDSLRLELKRLKKNIGITTVTPYYINTGMFDGVKSIVPILKPESTARKIIKAIESNRKILSMPWGIHLVRISQGLLPIWLFDWLVGEVFGIYHTMDNFKGHQKK